MTWAWPCSCFFLSDDGFKYLHIILHYRISSGSYEILWRFLFIKKYNIRIDNTHSIEHNTSPKLSRACVYFYNHNISERFIFLSSSYTVTWRGYVVNARYYISYIRHFSRFLRWISTEIGKSFRYFQRICSIWVVLQDYLLKSWQATVGILRYSKLSEFVSCEISFSWLGFGIRMHFSFIKLHSGNFLSACR